MRSTLPPRDFKWFIQKVAYLSFLDVQGSWPLRDLELYCLQIKEHFSERNKNIQEGRVGLKFLNRKKTWDRIMFLPRLVEARTKPDFCSHLTLNLKNTVHLGHVHPHIWLQLVESFSNSYFPWSTVTARGFPPPPPPPRGIGGTGNSLMVLFDHYRYLK